jgi:hypothetical protein
MKYFILTLVSLAIVLIPNKFVLAYASLTTHSGLTENITAFYNFSAAKKITNTQMEWLVQGSQNEDNGLRCLNHAYDPIYNRGWHPSIPNIDIGYTSKEWSQSESAQISFGAMDFSGIKDTWESLWLGPNSLDSNQTWNKAIYEYLNGHEKEAFVALGHVLHLIEDTTVPAHVRANSHPDILGKYSWSDYEEKAKMYDRATLKNYATTLYNQGLLLSKFDSLNSLFDDLATKVNNYFYSDDTIRSGEYKYPQPEYEGKLPEGYFVMGNDYKGKTIHLAYKQSGVGVRLESGLDVYTLNNDLVFKDYWQSLSPLAISYGSSTIDLFFKEVQKAAQDKDYLARNNQSTLTKLAANLLNLTVDLNNGQSGTTVSTYPEIVSANVSSTNGIASTKTSITTLQKAKVTTTTTTKAKVTTTTINKPTTTTSVKPTTTTTKRVTTTTKLTKTATKASTTTTIKSLIASCTFNSTNYLSGKTIVLNEIAWMGSLHSPNDEWIELKNLTNQNINLSQWQIISKTGNIKIIFPQTAIIPAYGFYLLERTDDTSVPYTTGDLFYTGSLNNTNDGLKLFNSQCLIADEVIANSDWPAGDAPLRRTMERGSDLNWHTYSYANGYNNVFGTPKAENSPSGWQPPSSGGNNSTVTTQPTSTSTSTTTTKAVTTTTINNTATTLATTTTLPRCNSTILEDDPQVIFNEIAWMGSTNSSNDEWIELKNISGVTVDISSWQIFDKTGNIKIAIPNGTILSANQIILLERTNDDSVPGIPADLIFVGAINNTDETLSLYDDSCKLIDQTKANPDWPAGDKDTFKTMERGNDLTWHTYCGNTGKGSPKEENSLGCVTTTTVSTTTTTIPSSNNEEVNSYLSDIKWHPFENGKTSQYLEFKTNNYPFIPNIVGQEGENFSAMALYLNQDVPTNLNLGWSNPTDWQVHQGETNSALILGYYNCGHYPTDRGSLVFPVISNTNFCRQCYGHDCAINCNYIPQDHEFIFEVKNWRDNAGDHGLDNITANDYFTVGFYSYNPASRSMDLVLADNHKYYFNPNDTFQAPQSIQDLDVHYDDINKQTILKFSPAQDADTPERKLNYFIAYAHTLEDLNQEKYNFAFSKGASELSKDEHGQYTYIIPNSEMGDYDMFNGSNYYFTIKAYDPQMLFSSLWVPKETDKIVIPPEPKPPMVLSTYFKDIKFSFTKPTENDIPRLTLEYELINSGKAPKNLNYSAILAAWDYNPGLEFQIYDEAQQKLTQNNSATNEYAGWLYAYLPPYYPYVVGQNGTINYGGSSPVLGKQRVIIKKIEHPYLNNGQPIINVDGITEADISTANFTLDNNAYTILAYGNTDGNINKWYWFTHSSEPTYFTQN